MSQKERDWPALAGGGLPSSLQKYVDETIRNLHPIEEGQILPRWKTETGWVCFQVPWLVVPGYDFEDACKGQVTEDDIRRELCLDWHASSGKKVLTEFSMNLHVAAREIPFDPERPLFCGWDMPGTPAFVATQLNAYGQWCLLSSIQPREDDSIGVYEFSQMVRDHLLHRYALPHDLELSEMSIYHYGDPSGNAAPTRSAGEKSELRSCFEVIRDGVTVLAGYDDDGNPIHDTLPGTGWRIMSGSGRITERLEALRARLRLTVAEGQPALIICPTATALIDAFSSYEYRELAGGRYDIWPYKNWACVDTETEAKTPSGWKRYDELRPGDEICVYDMELDRELTGTVIRVNVFEGPVPALRFHNRLLNMVVTPEHRCVVRDRANPYPARFVEAKDLNESHFLLTRARSASDNVESFLYFPWLKREELILDRVWCPTTDAGTWIARRKGKVFVTGNSHAVDAAGYVATRLFERPTKADDDAPRREPWRSRAAGRY